MIISSLLGSREEEEEENGNDEMDKMIYWKVQDYSSINFIIPKIHNYYDDDMTDPTATSDTDFLISPSGEHENDLFNPVFDDSYNDGGVETGSGGGIRIATSDSLSSPTTARNGRQRQRSQQQTERWYLKRSLRESEWDRAWPKKSFAYQCFRFISGGAVVVSIAMVLAQLVNLWGRIHDSNGHVLYMQHLLRGYMVLFCIMFVLAELRIETFLQCVPSLDNWVYRGFLYSFIGVIGGEMSKATLAEHYPAHPGLGQFTTALVLKVVSSIMFVMGLVYMIMGVCCLHGVWERIKQGYDDEMEQATASSSPIRVR